MNSLRTLSVGLPAGKRSISVVLKWRRQWLQLAQTV